MAPPKGHVPWNKGTKGVCEPNAGSFRPGNVPWTAGMAGTGKVKPNVGSFGRGINRPGKPVKPAGSKRWSSKDLEVFVKVPEPGPYAGRYPNGSTGKHGHWRPLRLVNFEAVHGPIPLKSGFIVRRLLPICDCEPNLVLITPAVHMRLNDGRWANPPLPWDDLPLDADVRLATVIAAIAAVEAKVKDRSIETVACECGCGTRIKRYDRFGRRRRYAKGHNGRWQRHSPAIQPGTPRASPPARKRRPHGHCTD